MTENFNFVVAVIMNEKNQLLLLKRSATATRNPNTWGLAGGRLEQDETVDEGMYRELGEELGTNLDLQLVSKLGHLPAIGMAGGTVHLFHFIWKAGEIQLNPEHTAFLWVHKHAALKMDLMPGVRADLTFFRIWSEEGS